MQKRRAYLFYLLLALLAFACEKGPEKAEPKVYMPDEFVINTLTFDDGTWWAYEDSATGKKDTLTVSSASWSTQQNPNGKNGERTLFSYLAKFTQSSTGRELFLSYNIRDDYGWNHQHTPIVEIVNYYNSFGRGTESLIFNTTLHDTIPSGSAKVNGEWVASHFVLTNQGTSIILNAKTFNHPFMEVKIIGSVIYDFNELNLLLIKNVGIAKHNLDGNFSLVDYHLNPISF